MSTQPSILDKECRACKQVKPTTEFYKRSGFDGSTIGHYLSECKTCMGNRSKVYVRAPRIEAVVESEKLAIDYLASHGHSALPGKAVFASHTDVVAWGCVGIEIKYSLLKHDRGSNPHFTFDFTSVQIERGLLGRLIMLICDYGEHQTYHLFSADDEKFYRHKDGRLKSAVTYTPNRSYRSGMPSVFTDAIMELHQDATHLIWQAVKETSDSLVSA